jgi:hypothetical protein
LGRNIGFFQRETDMRMNVAIIVEDRNRVWHAFETMEDLMEFTSANEGWSYFSVGDCVIEWHPDSTAKPAGVPAEPALAALGGRS